VSLLLFLLATHDVTLHKSVSEPKLLSMELRGRRRGGRFADLNDVHKREEATREEQQAVCLQQITEEHLDEQFERIGASIHAQIRALAD